MPDQLTPPPFRCEVDSTDGALVHVRPVGELDMASAPVLEEHLRQVHVGGGKRVVVDLRGLEFMDSTGLSLLLRWANGAEQDGFDFALIAGSDRIQRLFELTKLTSHFQFVDG